GGGIHDNAGSVVVLVGGRNIGGIDAVVRRVGAARRAGDDRVRLIAVVDKIIDAGGGHRLRDVPIQRIERQGRLIDGSLGGVGAGDGDGDGVKNAGGGLIEDDGEGCLPAAFGGDQPAGGGDGDAGGERRVPLRQRRQVERRVDGLRRVGRCGFQDPVAAAPGEVVGCVHPGAGQRRE